MCGLIAILDWEAGGWGSSLAATRAVKKGLDRMSYRGLPGRSMIVQEGKAILGHTRLPIINISEEFDQPYERGGTVGVYVGEIFNYKELYLKNYTSDIQVLFDIFNNFGLREFRVFDGFWAAVFTRKEKVTVITDYLSQKPLYFDKARLLVASEPEAVLAAYDQDWQYDEVYLSNVLKWGYSPDHRTPWIGLQQLPVGSVLTYPPGPTITPYWDWSQVPTEPDLTATLTEAVKNRLVGDRDVALLLSGGLDSTIIYKIMDKLNVGVLPFHIENNEGEYLAAVGVDSKELLMPPVYLEPALKAHQVPVDLGSMVAQYGIAIALREKGYHVAMSGDGADELFGGYRRAKEYDSQASDVFIELPFYHLPKLDRIMMNQTIELRCPFLAPKVIKQAFQLDWDVRQSKQFLKHKFKDLVPKKILDRPKHPLKSNEVLTGGVEYRKKLVELWKEMS
jgi:asparagine synthase (glutamine-hydrolysing)